MEITLDVVAKYRQGISRTRQNEQQDYSERLYLTWWAWPLPLAAAVLLAAEVHMGYPGVRSWLPYAIALPLVVGLLVLLGQTPVRISGDGEDRRLTVGDANLPVRFIGRVDVIDSKHKRLALGPELDPAAYVLHRAWIGTMVRVHLDDPDDPTPYWLFSTRHPDALAAALGGERPRT